MTEIKDILSLRKDHGLNVLLVPQGRKLYFDKECLEEVTIQRKVNDGEWAVLAKNIRTPYIDGERFTSSVVLKYKAIFEKQNQYEDIVEVHLN